MDVTVAIDCMGGDHGPQVTVPAALDLLRLCADVNVILVGLQDDIDAQLRHAGSDIATRVAVRHASEVVGMDEAPASALRGKKDSSLRVAVNLVKDGSAHACVSAGNTGALMAISRFVLKMLPGVERPAIASMVPTMRGRSCVLDLGANVDCTPLHLLQFAVMGAALFSAVEKVERPAEALHAIALVGRRLFCSVFAHGVFCPDRRVG